MLEKSMQDFLGINIEKVDEKEAIASLFVSDKVCQIHGFLNGGASLALAEILAGTLSTFVIDKDKKALGTSISANHLNVAKLNDTVKAHATFLKCGKRLHVIEVSIYKDDLIISKATITNTIV